MNDKLPRTRRYRTFTAPKGYYVEKTTLMVTLDNLEEPPRSIRVVYAKIQTMRRDS